MRPEGSSKVPSDGSWAPLGRLLGASWATFGASWAPLGASWSAKSAARPPKGLPKVSKSVPKGSQRPPKGLPKASQRPPEGLLKGSQRHPKASKRLLRILSAFGDFLESLWRPLRNYANAFRCTPLRFNGYAGALGGLFRFLTLLKGILKVFFSDLCPTSLLKRIFISFCYQFGLKIGQKSMRKSINFCVIGLGNVAHDF
jgi:hypothetical protein